jgi:hypothetical protein
MMNGDEGDLLHHENSADQFCKYFKKHIVFMKLETDIITSIIVSLIGETNDDVCQDLQNFCY